MSSFMGFKIGHPFLKYAIERMFVGYKASRYGSLLQQFFRNVRGFCRDHCLVSESLLEKSSENFNCCDVKIIGKFSCSSWKLRAFGKCCWFFYSSRLFKNQILSNVLFHQPFQKTYQNWFFELLKKLFYQEMQKMHFLHQFSRKIIFYCSQAYIYSIWIVFWPRWRLIYWKFML